MAQAVPNMGASMKIFKKLKVNWNTVCGAIQDVVQHNIWFANNTIQQWWAR